MFPSHRETLFLRRAGLYLWGKQFSDRRCSGRHSPAPAHPCRWQTDHSGATGKGGIFGESLSFSPYSISPLQIYCAEKSTVLYIDYRHLIKRCYKACSFHSQLVNNALQMISQKAVQLSERLEVLSQRTIREKIQCYFSILATQAGTNHFTLPFSYSTLRIIFCGQKRHDERNEKNER